MIKVGITGGIGSGKSICCKIFHNLGTPIYEADSEAKSLMESDPVIINGLKQLVGDSVYQDGNLDRASLAKSIFGNKHLLKEVNAIVHPQVRLHFEQWCLIKEQEGFSYIVYEAAILFESGFYTSMNRTIVVVSPLALRIERAMQRDNSSREDVTKRIDNQWSDEKKCTLSDFILYNNNTTLLVPQVVGLHNDLSVI